MSDLNAAPSSTEPASVSVTIENKDSLAAAPLATEAPAQEAGAAAVGESVPSAETVANATAAAIASGTSQASDPVLGGDAPAIVQEGTASADSINLGAHLSRLDEMLAELERKIAAGIHTFAHEITAARDHLAKLL
ncbi:hypothetical protein [Burkholderia vietnamiensis]|uniref:hypothetical protein n=1 Tax=Burkholderia vietnamiensis TaxID=60552 RepID=UPI001594BE19|nr:hypothetical protein [Burkholderia vietnamiensis]